MFLQMITIQYTPMHDKSYKGSSCT